MPKPSIDIIERLTQVEAANTERDLRGDLLEAAVAELAGVHFGLTSDARLRARHPAVAAILGRRANDRADTATPSGGIDQRVVTL